MPSSNCISFSLFFSKLLNRIERGAVPCTKINKRVKNIHQALENQNLVIQGAQHSGVEVQNISAEDLWSGKVWTVPSLDLVKMLFFIF